MQKQTNVRFITAEADKMKVKAILKFYFTAEEAFANVDRLIYKNAFSVSATRGAYDCAEEVANLIYKKGALAELWNFLDGVIKKFSDGERDVLGAYALSPRMRRDDGREEHRLAVAFARRIKGCGERFREGIAAMRDFCFW